MTITLTTRHDITLPVYRAVAFDGETVTIGAAAKQVMATARAAFERLLDDPEIVIYGVTSGYGHMADRRYTPAERRSHARRPPSASASSFGAPFPGRVTRGIVLARLANYLGGHAAARPEIAEAIAALLAAPELPRVPAEGNGGAGEIQALGHLFAPLGQRLDLKEKEALTLVNGSPVSAALVADAALIAAARLPLVERIFALAAEAIRLPLDHIDPALAELWGDGHEAAALNSLGRLLAGGGATRRPYQAPVSFRVVPRLLGRLRRALDGAEAAATLSLSAVTDNPIFVAPDADHPNGRVLSNGGFQNCLAPPALDELAAVHADLCTLAERQGAKLLTGAVSGLPDNLVTDAGPGAGLEGYLGCLPMAQVGFAEAARRAAQRTFLPGSESGGYGQNDVAVATPTAWLAQDAAGRLLDRSLSLLALIAERALTVTERGAPPALGELRDRARAVSASPLPGENAARLCAVLQREIYPDHS